MCLGIPGRVVEIVPGFADQLALVDVQGAERRVNIGLLDAPPAAGDWILIHMGFAVELIDEAAAARALSGLELMGRPQSPQPVEPPDSNWARDLGWESDLDPVPVLPAEPHPGTGWGQ
jgi:hydrogenase maturation protein HypF